MINNVLQHRHFDLRQTINFAVEPIDNDDLNGERLRWRGRDDCWHYAAQFHVFLDAGGNYLRLSLASTRLPIHAIAITKMPSRTAAVNVSPSACLRAKPYTTVPAATTPKSSPVPLKSI